MDDTKNSNQNSVIPHDPHQDVPPPTPNVPPMPTAPDAITHNNDLPTESVIGPSSQNPLLASSDMPKEPEIPAIPVAEVMHSTATDSTIPSDEQNSGGSKKKLIAGIAVIVLLAVAIPAGIFLTSQNQDSRGQAQEAENTNIPAPLTERRLNVSGVLVAKTDDSLTLEDKGVKTTIKFLPGYTKIYQPPSAVEYSPVHVPLNTHITGSVFIKPKDRSSSGKEVIVGEILRLPVITEE